MSPLIRKSSFVDTIRLLSTGTNTLSPSRILWYPGCGDDFRVLHHPVTNNLSINPNFFIFNDQQNYEAEILALTNNNPNFECTSYQLNFPDLPFWTQCYYKRFIFNNGYVREIKKVIFLWNMPFDQILDILLQNESIIETIFIKRFNDDRIEENISNTMNQLNTKYYINSFYQTGFSSAEYYENRRVFAENNNLRLCQYSSYSNFGNQDINSVENVFVFESKNE